MERENAWKKYQTKDEKDKVFAFAEDYRGFLSDCKTERECTAYFGDKAKKAGYISLEEIIDANRRLKAGDKVYAVNKDKGIALFVIGSEDMEQGMNILGAHIDSPRLDLKQNPLYEDTDMVLLDTHYYGGVKKYQWVTLPLALHGVIAKKDGTVIPVNIGEKPVISAHGVVTSLAWSMGGKVNYVLEGNLNYTGAVITWLKDDLKLIRSPGETGTLAREAVQDDELYLIPAFSGLGAAYWDSRATAAIVGMTRTTGKAEVVRAGVECIAYQITDIVKAMCEDAGVRLGELRVDGGPTKNEYLMQFQSDIADVAVQVPDSEELSGIGPAYAAGLALGVWDESIFGRLNRVKYAPGMDGETRKKKYNGWKAAVSTVLTKR